MLRLFAVSLVFLLISGTVWAQDSPVVNRLDTHPDWLFQPDRGDGPSPPDTLDAWRYYPLAVGNAWEYRNMNNHTLRIDVTRDSIIDGQQYFHWQRVWYNNQGNQQGSTYNAYVRYDTLSTFVVTPNMPYFGWAPCRLDGQPHQVVECRGFAYNGLVLWMTYEGILEFSDTTVVNVPVKQYDSILGLWRYAADFGEVWASVKDGHPVRGLTFARIDEQTFGTELYPYKVSNEPELFHEPELTIQALWPNPARSSLSLRLRIPEAGQVHISVFDLLGREVLAWEGMLGSHEETIELDLGALSVGSYIVRMIAGNQISNGVLFTRIE